MIKEQEIRAHLAAYLCARVSLDDFEDWLVAESWNMHQDSDLDAQNLVLGIELALSEHSSGHLSDGELKQKLQALLHDIVVSIRLDISVVAVATTETGATFTPTRPVSLPSTSLRGKLVSNSPFHHTSNQ